MPTDSVTVLGQPFGIRSRSLRYRPGVGWESTTIYNGTPNAILGLLPGVSARETVSLDQPESPVHTLSVTSPEFDQSTGETDIATQWELLSNDTFADIYLHPSVRALGVTAIQQIKANILDPAHAATLTGDANTWYQHILAGHTGFYKAENVLKLTQLVAGNYTTKVGFDNVHKIYSTAKLKQEVNPPDTLLFSIDTVAATVPTSADNYYYGWLKKPPTVQSSPNGRFSISLEYWLDQWSTLVYPNPVI